MLTSFTAIHSPGNIRNIQSNSGCLNWVLVTRVNGHSATTKHTLQVQRTDSPNPTQELCAHNFRNMCYILNLL